MQQVTCPHCHKQMLTKFEKHLAEWRSICQTSECNYAIITTKENSEAHKEHVGKILSNIHELGRVQGTAIQIRLVAFMFLLLDHLPVRKVLDFFTQGQNWDDGDEESLVTTDPWGLHYAKKLVETHLLHHPLDSE